MLLALKIFLDIFVKIVSPLPKGDRTIQSVSQAAPMNGGGTRATVKYATSRKSQGKSARVVEGGAKHVARGGGVSVWRLVFLPPSSELLYKTHSVGCWLCWCGITLSAVWVVVVGE